MKKIAQIIASGFGSGYLPTMPGTWGSLVGLGLTYLLMQSLPVTQVWLVWYGLSFVGWLTAHYLITSHPNHRDPSYIVIDEISGILLAALCVLKLGLALTPQVYLLIFLTFRLFDITKPFPIRSIERFFAQRVSRAGLGVMIDDWLAAGYAALTAWGIVQFLPIFQGWR